ncbi:hypothetical protein VTJ49DRAFT_2731 [Mycothermus thermophilus]|uniref:Uncharacterized protein n=1 Tax=Humicola insolens TaxID=85995 RepID=A0ABR3VMP9_HUMIN
MIYEHVFPASDLPIVTFKVERRPGDDDRPRIKPTFQKPPHWLALLYTCRQTYIETIPFVMFSPVKFGGLRLSPEEQLDEVQCFLETIGRPSAAFLTFIRLGFPELQLIRGGVDAENNPQNNAEGEIRGVELARADLDVLRVLQEHCPRLRYVGFVVYLKAYLNLLTAWTTMNQGVWDDVKRAMARVDAELQKFPLLLRADVVMGKCSSLKKNPDAIGYELYTVMNSFTWRLLGT